jgi:hypothetical protein
MVPQVDHDCVLPNPFQLIILQSLYYLILQSELLIWYYSLNYWFDTTVWITDLILQSELLIWYYSLNYLFDTTVWITDLILHSELLIWYYSLNYWFDTTVWITDLILQSESLIWYYSLNYWLPQIKQKPLHTIIFAICYLCFLEVNILHNTAIDKINVQSTALLSFRGLWLWYVVLPFVGVHSHIWLYCWCRIKWAVSYFIVCIWFWNCYRWLAGNLCFSLQLMCWNLIWNTV